MTFTPKILTIELRDLQYNQSIDNTCCYSLFIYPTRSDKGMLDNICQHWEKSRKTMSGMQENQILTIRNSFEETT